MSLDAALDAVPDGTDGQFALESPEGGFYFGELHVFDARERQGPWDRDWCARDRRPDAAWLRADEPYSKDHKSWPLRCSTALSIDQPWG